MSRFLLCGFGFVICKNKEELNSSRPVFHYLLCFSFSEDGLAEWKVFKMKEYAKFVSRLNKSDL